MRRQIRTWAMWGFWLTVTFSPLIVSMAMVLFGPGFNIWVWASTVSLAFFGFFKAQQSAGAMRALEADQEIENWLSEIRRTKSERRLKTKRAIEPIDGVPSDAPAAWELSRGWTEFRQHRFWKELDEVMLTQHAGDLFHLLGLDVRKIGSLLLINGNTLVAVVNHDGRSAPEVADRLVQLINEKASCKAGIVVSPWGYKPATRKEFKGAPVILMDAGNLAHLSQKYIG